MNKNTPAGKKPDTDSEETGQDESGKTAAPQSPQGPQQPPKAKPPAIEKKEEPRPM